MTTQTSNPSRGTGSRPTRGFDIGGRGPVPDRVTRYRPPAARRFWTKGRAVIAAVAELSDGTYWSSQASVVVTLAACIEDF